MKNVRDFGAKGDGISKDTSAIQAAIDAGGIVWFPPGTYLCGTLYLKSNGGLELSPGAVLLASPDLKDYNADDFCPQNRVFKQEFVTGKHFITAVEQHNITIRGGGRIDGNRKAFYEVPSDQSKIWSTPLTRPGQMIFLCECENVTISDVELYNSPYWTCFLHGCEMVQIRGVRIYNHQYTRNGDGIDIDCCRFVNVSDCLIDCGDDCITLRGYDEPLRKKRACEYITITNCVLRTICNAFRIGVGTGTVRAAVISNCIIHDSRNAITLCSKYSPDKGVLIEDIQFDNIDIEAQRPLVIVTNAHGRREGKAVRPIRRISFSHLRGRAEAGSVMGGYAPGDVSDISLNDAVFDYSGGENIASSEPENGYAEVTSSVPPAAFWIENVSGFVMTGCAIRWKTDNPHWKNDVEAVHCSNPEFINCRFKKGILQK